MNSKEIREAINETKFEIYRAIDLHLDALRLKIGFSPSAVTINMMETTTISSEVKDFRVLNVNFEFKL